MATWELKALRKLLEGITGDKTPDKKRKKKRPASEEDYIRKAQGIGPDEEIPEHWEIDERGGIIEHAWPKEMPQTGAREAFERAAELERTLNLPFGGFEDTYTGDSPDWYLSDEELEVVEKGDKLKLDWVNEILKEFQEDKAPEVLRLPHLKDEEKPDMSPFLSYMLSQSPYARLPAAGLLGIGSMLYSKPAY